MSFKLFVATNIRLEHPKERNNKIRTKGEMAMSTWNLDPTHSVVEFKVKHMMISNVKGQFEKMTGVLNYDPADKANASIEATVDVASINTHDAQRDAHLKGADFFDADKFPTMTFKSFKVLPTDGIVEGELTIKGVTRTVEFDVAGPTEPGQDPWGNTRVGIEVTAKISRKDFGLTWNAALETGGVLVGDEVTITIEAQFVKAA
jgi:polyisoprenoid-binding protein YceI